MVFCILCNKLLQNKKGLGLPADFQTSLGGDTSPTHPP